MGCAGEGAATGNVGGCACPAVPGHGDAAGSF